MKKLLLTTLALLMLLGCSTTPIDVSSTEKKFNTANNVIPINADKAYLALQSRAEIDDVTLDYTALRKAYTKSSFYQPYGSDERKRVEEAFNLFASKKFDLCLDSTREILKTNFISLGAHYATVVCARSLNMQDKAYLHEEILEGLFDSISRSGDGQSTETAYTTYTTEELYTFLQLNGLNVVGQGIINEDNKIFESMQISPNGSEEKFTLFFDITTQWTMAFADFNRKE